MLKACMAQGMDLHGSGKRVAAAAVRLHWPGRSKGGREAGSGIECYFLRVGFVAAPPFTLPSNTNPWLWSLPRHDT